jgi:SAM-dependent methyltransferase
MYLDARTGTRLPDVGEIQSAVPAVWSGIEDPAAGDANLFSRLDKSPDPIFYSEPRFVEHIDSNAVEIITMYISDEALQEGDRVLDLCSSWTSHIDPSKKGQLKLVSGLGMNEKELEGNPLLTDWIVRDLNANPKLPYDDNSFSVVLCQLSIDYLTRPYEVLKEAARVLEKGGRIHILFSNRLFIEKAVALWTGADDIDHTYTVACYLHFCGGNFQNIVAKDLSRRKGNKIFGDPVYVVSAVKT